MNVAPSLPNGIDRDQIVETPGPPAGSAAMIVLSTLLIAALLGWLGGAAPERYTSVGDEADIVVTMPGILRSGMFFETQIDITARKAIDDATIAVSPALWRSITINTQFPEPAEQVFKDGFYQFHYGRLEVGEHIRLKLDAQINPDLFLGNSGEIVLRDGDHKIARFPVTLTVLP